tara:strand:+ start:1151 stop:1285 length:135 start_codon:yes stop_codon:yes gene_type:complete
MYAGDGVDARGECAAVGEIAVDTGGHEHCENTSAKQFHERDLRA